jgi:hypothetical protein
MSDMLVITPGLVILFVIIAIWSGVWKAIALWKSARHRQIAWFVVLCIFNTIGILEIVYLAWFQKDMNLAVSEVKAAAKTGRKAVKKKE